MQTRIISSNRYVLCINTMIIGLSCCRSVRHIPDVAKDFRRMSEYSLLTGEVVNMQNRLQNLIAVSETNLKSIYTTRDDIKKQQSQIIDDIVKLLKSLQQYELTELEKHVESIEKTIQDDIARCRNAVQELSVLLKASQNSDDVSFAFIGYIKCKEMLSSTTPVCDAQVQRGTRTIEYQIEDSVQNLITSLQKLGTIEPRINTHAVHVFKATGNKTHAIKVSKYLTDVIDMCELPKGKVVAACSTAFRKNSELVLLDQSYTCLTHTNVDCHVNAVCYTSDNQIVAATETELHFYIVEGYERKKRRLLFTKQRSIKLQHKCIGVVHQNNILYVTSEQALYVHDLYSRKLQNLYEDTTVTKTITKCAVSNDGLRIYITDADHNRLVTIDNQGNLLATLTDDDMIRPEAVHVTPSGHVFVVCSSSQTVLQISHDGRSKLATVANANYALNIPLCVIYSQQNACLLVGCWGPRIAELKLI